jgi:hypothetical protein
MRGLHNLSAFSISSISQSHITPTWNCLQQGNCVLFQSVHIHFVDRCEQKFPLKCLTVHYWLLHEWCVWKLHSNADINVNVHKPIWIWYINNTGTQHVNQTWSWNVCWKLDSECVYRVFVIDFFKLICTCTLRHWPSGLFHIILEYLLLQGFQSLFSFIFKSFFFK